MDTHAEIIQQRQSVSARLLDQIRLLAPPVLDKYPVQAAYVYGSVARGTVTPFSDVDIAILLSTTLPAKQQFELELAIQGEIESALKGRTIDVRSINEAPLTVKGQVVQRGVLIYERDRNSRIMFEIKTRKLYFDFAPVYRKLSDAFLKHIQEHGLIHDLQRNDFHQA